MSTEPSDELDVLTHHTIGAAIEVHRRLGPGFSEAIYERAMLVELAHIGLPARSQVPVPIYYRDQSIGDGRIDLLIAERVVVELKTVEALSALHRSQVTSYLNAGGFELGLLLNFNVGLLRNGVKRILPNGLVVA